MQFIVKAGVKYSSEKSIGPNGISYSVIAISATKNDRLYTVDFDLCTDMNECHHRHKCHGKIGLLITIISNNYT